MKESQSLYTNIMVPKESQISSSSDLQFDVDEGRDAEEELRNHFVNAVDWADTREGEVYMSQRVGMLFVVGGIFGFGDDFNVMEGDAGVWEVGSFWG